MDALADNQVPFPESATLNADGLLFTDNNDAEAHHYSPSRDSDLQSREISLRHLPDEPSVSLTPRSVSAFMHKELATPLLDTLFPNLWLVAKQASNNIDPLHQQHIKGRQVVPVENAKMHLVWMTEKVYVKPVPLCLLNYYFWLYYLCPDTNVPLQGATEPNGSKSAPGKLIDRHSRQRQLADRAIALGFLRSYSYLIEHRSDFFIARSHNLIPEDINWTSWMTFIAPFRHIQDSQVAKRYRYGQLRLSRLNWAVRIFRPATRTTSWFYELSYWSTGPYVGSIITVLGFLFATLSLVLSAMQVALAAMPDLHPVASASWVFSLIVLFVAGVSWAMLVVIPFGVLMWQLSWGFSHRKQIAGEKQNEDDHTGEMDEKV